MADDLPDLQKAIELLIVAKCPNAHCVDGVIQEGFADDDAIPYLRPISLRSKCQFCVEREALLARDK